jgi:hypothetical protein
VRKPSPEVAMYQMPAGAGLPRVSGAVRVWVASTRLLTRATAGAEGRGCPRRPRAWQSQSLTPCSAPQLRDAQQLPGHSSAP